MIGMVIGQSIGDRAEHKKIGPPSMAGVVHKSAHPSLPPAAPQQVVQYLLANNFHLTALELLVETQQAGHGDDVRDLEAFFSDPDRFPPEELARYQPDNALDLQAIGRERESRLQMAEYELRLAKEDLAEMARKLAQAHKQQQQVPAADTTAAGPSPFSPGAAPQPRVGDPPGPGGPGVRLGSGGPVPSGVPNPAEQLALNTAVFAHLLRQGLVTTAMTMEEEYGGPLRTMGRSSASSVITPNHGSADSDHQWELWSWYQAAATMAAAPVTTASVSAVADSSAGAKAAGAEEQEGQAGGVASLMSFGREPVVATTVDPDDFIRQFNLGPESDVDLVAGLSEEQPMASGIPATAATAGAASAACDDSEDCGGSSQEDEGLKQLRAQMQALCEELAETRARARAAVVAAVGAAAAAAAMQRQQQEQVQQQQQQVHPASLSSRQSPALQPLSYISSDAAVLDLLDLGSSATPGLQSAAASAAISVATGSATDVAALAIPGAAAGPADRGEFKPEPADGHTGGSAAAAQLAGSVTGQGVLEAVERLMAAVPETHGSERASQLPPWMRRQEIDSDYHFSLEKLLAGLCDMLPRLVPNLNVKSRLEVLPLLVATAKATQSWTVRRQLLVAIFNLVPAPDHQQRQAIIDSSLDLCRAFGSGWAATELVQLCSRQVSSPSSERRTLVAETLGEAVGVVDPHTQAHVLLTQLSQLAKDRMDQVREAACHSLARLVPRLPFTRSYFATLEGLLLSLATDASEAVHVAALSYLVPALLTWQPQDTDFVLVSSCLARVLSDMSQHVRVIEQYQQNFLIKQQQQQQQQQAPPKAASAPGIPAPSTADAGRNVTSAATGGGFSGAFLRYTNVAQPSPSPPQPAQPPPEGQAGPGAGSVMVAGAKGSNSSLTELAAGPQSAGQVPPLPPPSPVAASIATTPTPSTPPPPQWVNFGRRSFPSLSHLQLYQLLALYSGLTPALRQAALRTSPAWACRDSIAHESGPKPGAGAAAGIGSIARPQSGAADSASNRRPFKAGSFGSAAAPGDTGAISSGGAAVASNSALDDISQLLPSTHRRTSSQPVFGGFGPTASNGGLGGGGGGDGQSSVLADRLSLQTLDRMPFQQTPLSKSSSNSAIAKGEACCGTGDSAGQAVEARSAAANAATGDMSREDGGAEGTLTEDQAQQTNGIDQRTDESVEELKREEDASLALWASHGSHGSWKALEWLMQHVVPELIRLVCCVGPVFPEAFDVWKQAACAVAATCNVLGALFTQAAMEPLFLVTSGTGAHLAAGTGGSSAAAGVVVPDLDVPVAIRDICSSMQPRTPEALYMARHCVLPVLMVSVLPSARQLRPYLLQLMGSAHELRHRWLLEALPEYTIAITYTCSQRPDLVPQVLHVLEDLLSGAGSSQANIQAQNITTGQQHTGSGDAVVTPAASTGTSGGPASTHVGLCCAALARAMVPVASLELASRRLLPGLMALMSYGEPELQRACVGVLGELGQRFRDQGSRVSEQVLAVYDSLLEQGSHVVQQEVLAAGTAMAAAAAPSAAVAAAAAAQVEWLLTAVQVVAARITSAGANGSANAGGPLTLEQQRALAAQLLSALRAVSPFDLRLPRLRANLNSALDSMQRCKALLPDPQQQAALAALLKERPAGPSAGGASISSTPPSSAVAVATAATMNVTSLWTAASQPLPPVLAYASPSASGMSSHIAATGPSTLMPTPAAAGGGGSTGSSGLLLSPFFSPAGAAAQTLADGSQAGGAGGQIRSRFDAFRQRLMKRRDDAPAAVPSGSGGGAVGGVKLKENFFSDDEGE